MELLWVQAVTNGRAEPAKARKLRADAPEFSPSKAVPKAEPEAKGRVEVSKEGGKEGGKEAHTRPATVEDRPSKRQRSSLVRLLDAGWLLGGLDADITDGARRTILCRRIPRAGMRRRDHFKLRRLPCAEPGPRMPSLQRWQASTLAFVCKSFMLVLLVYHLLHYCRR